ncbi:bacitracin resistance protein [Microbacterium sp.]|uniref:bacitracin resistance protein n=1 Tax=Microbacterium sp. TaxID=51671 RepID=UPI003F717B5B
MSARIGDARRPALPTWRIATIAGLFGLFYAYAVWTALDFLILQANGYLGLNGLGWFVLLFAVVFPILVFAAAFALGWRRVAWQFALILLTGLALVAVLWLNVLAFATTSFSIYGG